MRHLSRILAVDCGASHVAGALFTADRAGRLTLARFAMEVHGSPPGSEREWVEITGQALAALVGREKLRGEAVLALPGWVGLVKFGRTPTVTPSAHQHVMRFEAEQTLPHALDELVWDWRELADDGTKLDFVLAAAKAPEVDRLCQMAQAAAVVPTAVTPAGLALEAASRVNYLESGRRRLVVDIGARSTLLVFLRADGGFLVRSLTLAGNTITQAVADEQQIDFTSAEALKREVLGGGSDLPEDSPLRDAVRRAADNFTQKLQWELTRAMAAHRRQTGTDLPEIILLTGGGALLPGLAAALGVRLNLPVETYAALDGINLSAQARREGVESAAYYVPVLTGLAVAALRPAARGINLLPAAFGADVVFRRAQPWWLAGVALLILAVLPPLWHWHTAARNHRTEIMRLEQQMAPLHVARYAQDLDRQRQEANNRELAKLGRLVAARNGWVALLAELQAGLVAVEDVWLDRLQILPELRAVGAPADEEQPPVLRLALSGRLLDTAGPQAKVNPGANDRVRRLFAQLQESRFVRAVTEERFDASQPGILRFDFTLVINPEEPL